MYADLVKWDVIERFQEFLDGGGMQIAQDGRLDYRLKIDHNSPWIHHTSDESMYCMLFHLIHRVTGHIHERCMNCWKVVCRLPTVMDLLAMEQIQAGGEYEAKCGMEMRPTVEGHFGSYWYCGSREEGLGRLDTVRGIVKELPTSIPENDVWLKRYCTEFELAGGPTDEYVRPPEYDVWQKIFEEIFVWHKPQHRQPEYLKRHIRRRWIEFASDRADPTVRLLNDNQPLHRGVVRYERDTDRATEIRVRDEMPVRPEAVGAR